MQLGDKINTISQIQIKVKNVKRQEMVLKLYSTVPLKQEKKLLEYRLARFERKNHPAADRKQTFLANLAFLSLFIYLFLFPYSGRTGKTFLQMLYKLITQGACERYEIFSLDTLKSLRN